MAQTEADTPLCLPGSAVEVEDHLVAWAIRTHLGREDAYSGPISCEEMRSLVTLHVSSAAGIAVHTLSGLEHATQLETLEVGARVMPGYGVVLWNRISDLEPLRHLRHLRVLKIEGGLVDDLTPLRSLHDLQELTLRNLGLTGLSIIEELSQLRVLELDRNAITHVAIPADGNLARLRVLDLHDNALTRIDLQGLHQLELLDLTDNNPESLSLGDLPLITTLRLDGARDRRIWRYTSAADHTLRQSPIPKPVAGVVDLTLDLPQLEELYLVDLAVRDLSALANLPRLRVLDLRGSIASDLGPLASLEELERLTIRISEVVDLAPLGRLTGLTFLGLRGAHAHDDLEDLALLPKLRALQLDTLHPEHLAVAVRIPTLNALILDAASIHSLEPFSTWPRGEGLLLDLQENLIHDLQPLVDNPLFGASTRIVLWRNCLDTSPGSTVSVQIAELEARGVEVDVRGQYRFCIGLAPEAVSGGVEIEIPDVHLKRMLAFAIGSYEVTDRSLGALSQLTLDCTPSPYTETAMTASPQPCIRELTGLEHAADLRTLSLRALEVADLGPIGELHGLRTLELHSPGNLDPLRQLTELERVTITGFGSPDLTPLLDNASFATGDRLDLRLDVLPPEFDPVLEALRARGVLVVMEQQ